MKNGDIWRSFKEAEKAKGPHRIQLTKVKGHATEDMVEKGDAAGSDKAGNDEADYAVEE